MTQITINQLLEMRKRLQDRKTELSHLVTGSAQETSQRYPDGSERITKSKYDVIDLDTRVSQIQEAMYEIDSKVKEANAKTKIDISGEFNFKNLIAPIKSAS